MKKLKTIQIAVLRKSGQNSQQAQGKSDLLSKDKLLVESISISFKDSFFHSHSEGCTSTN
ncbi:hypothetical protein [Chryseobacterium sp. OV279]|uniref:hypothetical protein n=1 Tax=Chryseobacterium sp. OV279 TaxID=1500285 RepID=UPI000A6E333C|nr:hypothetical protein [Chryseobacterium sp. OV279]